MDIHALRAFCADLPGTSESIKWGNDLVFSVGEKMYLVTALDETRPLSISFKTTPLDFGQLTHLPGILPAPYLARHHWIRLENMEVLPKQEIEGLIRQAHALVLAKLPKRRRDSICS